MESRGPALVKQFDKNKSRFLDLKFSETPLYSLRAFNLFIVSPKLLFQTTQVTLTHVGITTGFDS